MIVLKNFLPNKISFKFKNLSRNIFHINVAGISSYKHLFYLYDCKSFTQKLVEAYICLGHHSNFEYEEDFYKIEREYISEKITFETIETDNKYHLIFVVKTIFGFVKFFSNICPIKKNEVIEDLNFETLQRFKKFRFNNKVYMVKKVVVKNHVENSYSATGSATINNHGLLKEMVKKHKNQIKCCHEYYVFYDIETFVKYDDAYKKEVLMPFMLCSRFMEGNFFQTKQLSESHQMTNLIVDDYWDELEDFTIKGVFGWNTWQYKRDQYNELSLKFNFRCVWPFVDYLVHLPEHVKNKYKLHESEKIKIYIIGFNNSKFDNNFILEEFRKSCGGKLTFNKRFAKNTKVVFQENNIEWIFDDIIKFLPDTSLKNACKQYNIKSDKIEFDILKYGKDCSRDKNIIETGDVLRYIEEIPTCFINPTINQVVEYYCLRDVLATCQLFLRISSTLAKLNSDLADKNIIMKYENFFSYVSSAQLAFSIFKQFYRENSEYKSFFKFESDKTNEFIVKSCCGGRVNFGVLGEYNSNSFIRYMDVTSEYPLAMTAYFPSTKGGVIFDPNVLYLNSILESIMSQRKANWDNGDLFNVLIYKKMFWGIFLCNCYPPEDQSQLIPFSPISIKNVGSRNTFSNSIHSNIVLNSIHIRTFIFAGWRVEILPCTFNIQFEETEQIFLPFIDTVGHMKTVYRKSNTAYAKLLKLILNSVSGKLAQKSIADYYQCININGKDEFNDDYQLEDYSTSLHYLSSYVTGYANWILFSTAYKLHKDHFLNKTPLSDKLGSLLYCDTDSLVFDENLVDKNFPFNLDEEIGRWNEDKCDFDITWKEEHPDEIRSIIVLARKSYVLLDEHKKLIDTKLKGVHSHQQSKITYDILLDICNKNPYKLSFDGLERRHASKKKDIALIITEQILKKTINIEKNFYKLIPTNNQDLNIDNLFRSETKYLDFVVPDGSPGSFSNSINVQPKPSGRKRRRSSESDKE